MSTGSSACALGHFGTADAKVSTIITLVMSGDSSGPTRSDWSRRRDLAALTIPQSATIHDAIQSIQGGMAQVALVVDPGGHLVGTVTDGDIRRGLLRSLPLDETVQSVMNSSFTAVDTRVSDRHALEIMRRECFHQMPVVDRDGILVALIVLEDLLRPPRLDNKVLLMAGGEGRRLLPLTQHLPKPMLTVGDRPMLEIIIEQCAAAGLTSFYISVNYLKHQVMEHFGDGSRWGVSIDYLEEDEPLGTAGALGLINDPLDAALLVINGDVLTRVDFRQLLAYHDEHSARATLCVRPFETQIPFGVISSDGVLLSGIDEKPVIRHYINAGVYVLDPDIVSSFAGPTRMDMPQLLERERASGPVLVFPIHEYWSDIGSPEAFHQAGLDWS